MIPKPPSRRGRITAYALVALSVALCAYASGVRLGPLFDAAGTKSALELLHGFASPDFSNEFLWRIATLSLESILIGVLATTTAAVLGVVAAFFIIKVPNLDDSPERAPFRDALGGVFRFVVRAVLTLFRSIPEVVWAFLFVRMIGLGPGAAVLAITVTAAGIFGKLFAELAESVEPESIRALRRLGVGRFGILLHGVLPQVWRQWLGYSFFRLECSVRSASILGIVGAGGLGTEIALSTRYFEYGKLATTLLAVLAFVIAIELLSKVLRRQSFKWTLGFALVGSVVALIRLPIPWSEMSVSKLVPEWITAGGGSETAAFVWKALKLAAQTVAMAWCATWGAAVIAMVLSPISAGTLSRRSHGGDMVVGRHGLGRAMSWLGFALSRLFQQACRAMPELTLALVFIVWVGPGSFAGVLAIGIHTIGVLGRLYSDVYEDVDPGSVTAIENTGASRFAVWLFGTLPQVAPRLLAFTLYRFEVNVRATAMVGFVGAGGIGGEIDTAISLFHGVDLLLLLAVLYALVVALDFFGDRVRQRIVRTRSQSTRDALVRGASRPLPGAKEHRRAERFARAKPVVFRAQGAPDHFELGTIRSQSAVGVFIETQTPCPKDTIIEFGATLSTSDGEAPRPDPASVIFGRVVYVREDDAPGMGVELLEPNAETAASDERAGALGSELGEAEA